MTPNGFTAQFLSSPLQWTHRHHRIVEMMVLGFTNNEICRELSYTPTRVSLLTRHPEIVAAAETLRIKYRERSIGSLHDDLEKDARNTFNKIVEHRNNADPDVSLRACSILFDRQIPKRTQVDETRTVRIVLERKDMAYLQQVAAEDDEIIDVSPPPSAPDVATTS